jgi:uncharacterized protein (DUF58 family)
VVTDKEKNKIKKIVIHTRRLMQSTLVGDYLSAFKGTGLEFDQIREYQIGDDVRFIDWNSSAKSNKIMIKQFVEERDRTVILAIDVSASGRFSSEAELRSQTISNVACALAFIATHNKDKVGALFFSDKVEKWIPPSRSTSHYVKILEAVTTLKPKSKKTDIEQALRFLLSLKSRNAILFMLSDWIGTPQTSLLKIARFKFDFIGIRFLDKVEKQFPNVGILKIDDPETGMTRTIDTKTISKFLRAEELKLTNTFKKYKIDLLDLVSGKPFVNDMIKFFHQRTRRQIS